MSIPCAAKSSIASEYSILKQHTDQNDLKTKPPLQPLHFEPQPVDNNRLAHLCGPMDENLRQISQALDVTLFRRGERFIVSGANAERAVDILQKFYAIADKAVSVED